jgi:hypothetical protein
VRCAAGLPTFALPPRGPRTSRLLTAFTPSPPDTNLTRNGHPFVVTCFRLWPHGREQQASSAPHFGARYGRGSLR